MGCGPAEERVLLTGLHAVADIYCECCKTTLGWKYVSLYSGKTKKSIKLLNVIGCFFLRDRDTLKICVNTIQFKKF